MRGWILWGAPLLLLAACANPSESLNTGLGNISSEIEELLGGRSSPNRYIQEIRSVHSNASLTFDPEAEDPVEVTREAIRGLATSDYETWRETAFTLQLLSSIAVDHPVALIRAEALDAVADMGIWTLESTVATEDWASEEEMFAALEVFREATGKDSSDTSLSFRVADAIRTVAAFDFENNKALPDEAGDRMMGLELSSRLRHVRGVLLPVTGRTLEGFLTDPDVRGAMDRVCVALSASVVRLTLTSSALREKSETTRVTAVKHLGDLPFPRGARTLGRVVLNDGESSVRRQAVLSLAKHDLADAVPPLIDALSDEMASVRGAAARALESVSGESFGDDRRAWTRWWGSQGKPDAAGVGSR